MLVTVLLSSLEYPKGCTHVIDTFMYGHTHTHYIYCRSTHMNYLQKTIVNRNQSLDIELASYQDCHQLGGIYIFVLMVLPVAIGLSLWDTEDNNGQGCWQWD